MEYAWIGRPGERVFARDFHNRCGSDYIAKDHVPWCKGCGVLLEPYGMNTPKGVRRFDHPNRVEGADPLDDCIHARRGEDRFAGIEPTDYDDLRGERLRAAFFDTGLAEAYAFCLELAGRGRLPVDRFNELIARADRRRIWAYVGLEDWIIPAVLLTLADHEGRSRDGRRYVYRFSFVVPRDAGRGAVLRRPEECRLMKSFDDGRPFTTGRNPLTLRPDVVAGSAGSHSWITPALLRRLRAAA